MGAVIRRDTRVVPVYSITESRAGRTLIAETEDRVAGAFIGLDADMDLNAEFPNARRVSETPLARRSVEVINRGGDVPLVMRGSPFQLRVWTVLQEIPSGEMISLEEIAQRCGVTAPTKMIAGACVSNRIAVLIPCHRVTPADATGGAYRWGTPLKARLMRQESEKLIRISSGKESPS